MLVILLAPIILGSKGELKVTITLIFIVYMCINESGETVPTAATKKLGVRLMLLVLKKKYRRKIHFFSSKHPHGAVATTCISGSRSSDA